MVVRQHSSDDGLIVIVNEELPVRYHETLVTVSCRRIRVASPTGLDDDNMSSSRSTLDMPQLIDT
jgi:hypothetical protein